MNILYCGDQKIRDGLITSILSLLKYNPEALNIFVLTAQIHQRKKVYHPIDDATIILLDQVVKKRNPESSVTKIDITYLFNQEKPVMNMNTFFTPNCMLRLYADELPEIPSKILYLDTDVLCHRNFEDYYYQDLHHHEIVGTLDQYGKWWFHHEARPFDYLNSGVLLLNMDLIRKNGLFAKCRRVCRTRWMLMPDQSAINRLCHTKRIVGDEYNEQHELHYDTVFRHFSNTFHFRPFRVQKVKPWQIERMHDVLHEHAFDDVLEEYLKLKEKIDD
ncbi:glycosyltransferase [Xylocopilactobacillus apicola]|uniref:Glycosyl transferase n=1 Tax=Xylocopilactobacillus apicola TaxID=2932184 RepID=A0AAU9DL74_9LACO|nr:glycosyltransferase [Xylocopilactobacillus apicola]BDR59311.1 glycosyl transferase [Xylocopilactobacillus apicola]